MNAVHINGMPLQMRMHSKNFPHGKHKAMLPKGYLCVVVGIHTGNERRNAGLRQMKRQWIITLLIWDLSVKMGIVKGRKPTPYIFIGVPQRAEPYTPCPSGRNDCRFM